MKRLETLTGFVVEDCGGEVYYAWSAARRNDVLVHCEPGQCLLAKWIEFEVDENGLTCEPAVVIGDRYEYSIDGRLAQILVNVRHEGCFRNRMEMFKHPDLGSISDPDHVVRNIQENASYQVWIAPNRQEKETRSRWVISTRSRDPQPNSQRNYGFSDDDSRRDERRPRATDYGYDQEPPTNHRPRSPSTVDLRQRSNSFERLERLGARNNDGRHRETYGYHPGPPTSCDNRRPRSPVNQQPTFGNMGHSSQNRNRQHRPPNSDGIEMKADPTTEEESEVENKGTKELEALRLKVSAMKELAKKLTQNEEVALAMQLANLEEFETLMSVVGKK